MIKFASSADTTIPANPAVGISYRNENYSQQSIEAGFAYNSTAPSPEYNQIEYLISEFVDLIEQCNVLAWSENTNYQNGAVIVASDNKMYQSKTDDNIGNIPESSSENWIEINEKINTLTPLLRKDLSNAQTTGTGQTIITSDSPQIISPDVTTQPAGTSSTKAASCEFVQNAAQGPSVLANLAVIDIDDTGVSAVPDEEFTITTPMPLRITPDVPDGAPTEIKSGTWVFRGVIGRSVMIQRVY